MATDATTATTTTAQDASAAPAAAVTTQTPPPAEGAATSTPEPFDFKALVASRLGKKGATMSTASADAGQKPAQVAAQDTARDAGEKPAQVAAETKPAEPAKPAEAKTPPPVADDIDARLKALHEANQRAAESRKMAKRQAELEAKAKAAENAHAKEVALAKAIEEARTKRDFVGLLKAAGFTLDEIKNSPLIVDMVDQFGKLDEGQVEQPKPVTETDIERMLKAREEAAAAERKAKEDAEQKERIAQLEIARSEYFAEVKVLFKAGDYPALRQAGTTQGQLDAYRRDYVAANPNHRPTAKELLDMAERDLRGLWKRNAEALAALEKSAKPAAEAKQPTEFVPASTVKPASKRTVTSRMTADVGGTAPPPAEVGARKPYREKEREMKDAFVARYK